MLPNVLAPHPAAAIRAIKAMDRRLMSRDKSKGQAVCADNALLVDPGSCLLETTDPGASTSPRR